MFFKSLLPALLWALFILIICGIPGGVLPSPGFLAWLKPDKLVHLFIFGVLSYLLMRAFSRQKAILVLNTSPKRWVFILCTAYGALIEVLQEYVFIDRSGDVRDVIADALGVIIGIGYFNYLMRKRVSS